MSPWGLERTDSPYHADYLTKLLKMHLFKQAIEYMILWFCNVCSSPKLVFSNLLHMYFRILKENLSLLRNVKPYLVMLKILFIDGVRNFEVYFP